MTCTSDNAPPPQPLDYANRAPKPPSERGNGFFNVCANLLLPGLGFWIIGRRRRAMIWLAICVLINAAVLLAIALPPLTLALLVVLPLALLLPAVLIADSYIRGHRPPRPVLGRPWARYLVGLVILLALMLLKPTLRLAFFARDHLCEAFIASDFSMQPALQPADMFLVSKLVPVRRWDVVAFVAPPPMKRTKWVERIVGLPGETVELQGTNVLINGIAIAPPAGVGPYQSNPGIGPQIGCASHPIHLGSDEYYLLGDNTARSGDARFWSQGIGQHQPGAMPRSNIIGRATWIYWPPRHWRRL